MGQVCSRHNMSSLIPIPQSTLLPYVSYPLQDNALYNRLIHLLSSYLSSHLKSQKSIFQTSNWIYLFCTALYFTTTFLWCHFLFITSSLTQSVSFSFFFYTKGSHLWPPFPKSCHTLAFSLCRSLSSITAAPFRVSSMISLGVIWTWRRELYSRIFRMSSRLKSLLTIGFVIVIISF